MSLVAGIFPNILNNFRRIYETPIRTIIRDHFPRPNERKRILRHGWKKRMSTPGGRRVLMNRILKGRFVYSH